MNKPKRSIDKYWTGTKVFDHIQYELDLEDYNQHLENDLEYHVKNRSELTKQLAEVHLYNKKMQKALEIMGVSITKEK